MEEVSAKTLLEAALFSSNEPLDMDKLKKLIDREASETKALIEELQADYVGHGVELVKVASGYRFQVPQRFASHMAEIREKNPPRYTRAFLETLALIVYRQPITRGEIEEIRGVAVNPKIIKTLQEREWIKVVGQRDVPGKPALLGSTKQFLDYFNLRSLSDLPPLSEVVDLEQAERQLTEQLTLAVIGHKGEADELPFESDEVDSSEDAISDQPDQEEPAQT